MDELSDFLDELNKFGGNHPIAASIIGAVIFFAIVTVYFCISDVLDRKRKKRLEGWLRENLQNVRAAVWIREPNNSQHIFQNMLEQRLVSHGMAIFNLPTKLAETLAGRSEWNDIPAASALDLAIVGRIITKTVEKEKNSYPTIKGVHTPTKIRFDLLPEGHPERRAPNAYQDNMGSSFSTDISLKDRFNIYVEPQHLYEERWAQEKIVVKILIPKLSIDVRFYGPSGQIHGAYAKSPIEEDGFEDLASEIVEKLADSVKTSLSVHERSVAVLELKRDRGRVLSED